MNNRKNHKILVIGPFPNPITGNSIANKVVYEGLKKNIKIQVKKIDTSTSFFDEKVGTFSIKKLLNSIRFNLEAYKILGSNVIYITPGQSFLGVLKFGFFICIAKLFRKKIVLHIHGNYLHQEYQRLNRLRKKIVKSILSLSNSGIVLSESLKPNLTPFLDTQKINVIYNFVEDYVIEDAKENIKKKSLDKLRIFYLSNLMLEKGILDLLEALKILERNNIPYEAKLAGNIDVSSRNKINEYFDILKNVSYLGVVDGKRKKSLLLWGNIFVFPSYYKMEGQPISILEAMATGNIVLASDHAGIADIFSLNNGLFIRVKDPKDIVQKINNVRDNKERYEEIMEHNHNYAINRFRSDKFLTKIINILTHD